MRIAVVTDSFAPQSDPIAETTRQIVDGLVAQGDDLLVVAPGPGQATYRSARVVRARRLVPASAMGTALRAFGPDVVMVVAPKVLGALGLRAAKRLGIPSIAVNPAPGMPPADLVLATCTAAAKRLDVPTKAWELGVNLDEHHPGLRNPAVHDRWARVDKPDGAQVVVGHVGALEKEKVVQRLLAISKLPGARVVVLGGGDGAELLRKAGAKVTGPVSGLDLARGIASLDLLVQPRKKELLVPGSRMALASGVPVVAFDAAGARGVVRHDRNGLLADPKVTGSLVESVALLVDDAKLRGRLAGKARASMTRTWSDANRDLTGHLRDLTPSKSRATG